MKKALLKSFLIFLGLTGCTSSYSASGPAYQPAPYDKTFQSTTFVNPETDAERSMRIWREESSR